MACALTNDPRVTFVAGVVTAAVIICFVMLVLDAMFPPGARPRRKPKL